MFHLTDGFTTDSPFELSGMALSLATAALMSLKVPAVAQLAQTAVTSVAALAGYWKGQSPRSRRVAPFTLHLAGPARVLPSLRSPRFAALQLPPTALRMTMP